MTKQNSNPNAVAALIFDGEGKLLLLKRSQSVKANPGQWESPGGKVDQGESNNAAIIREIKEESNITVNKENLELINQDYFANSQGKEHFVYVFKVIVSEKQKQEAKITETNKFEKLDWFTPQELKTLENLADYTRSDLVKEEII